MRKIVRIRKVELPGDKQVGNAILRIKGVNYSMSNAILNALNIDKNVLLGELPDKKLDALKEAIDNPAKLEVPNWMLNKRGDVVTGEDRHLTGTDIGLDVRDTIKRMKEDQSYKGFRLAKGLKVRGQRTKAHPRTGRAVGVVTKKKRAKMTKKDGGVKKPEAKKKVVKKA
jgi:small subunit ribosomal protein S13